MARLVREHGWKVGVVAQGHAVVEHMLDAIVQAGLLGSVVAKKVGVLLFGTACGTAGSAGVSVGDWVGVRVGPGEVAGPGGGGAVLAYAALAASMANCWPPTELKFSV